MFVLLISCCFLIMSHALCSVQKHVQHLLVWSLPFHFLSRRRSRVSQLRQCRHQYGDSRKSSQRDSRKSSQKFSFHQLKATLTQCRTAIKLSDNNVLVTHQCPQLVVVVPPAAASALCHMLLLMPVCEFCYIVIDHVNQRCVLLVTGLLGYASWCIQLTAYL